MRGFHLALAVVALAASCVSAQGRKSVPVGLVMGAGATITRDKLTAPIKPGEVLFAGDRIKAGASAVPFLFCPQKLSAAVAAKGEVLFEESEVTGAVENRKPVSACFLPAVQKLSVASQQHFGVMMTRAGASLAPKGSFDDRLNALTPAQRTELQSALAAIPAGEASMHAVRAATLEKAGLLYDALESYRAYSSHFDEAAWVKRKIIELENQLLKEQTK